MTLVRRVARPMLAAMFVVGGLDQLKHPSRKTDTAAPLIEKVAPVLGLPDDPELLVRANGAAMVGAGSLLALGRLPRIASTVLAATLVPTTLAGHAYWYGAGPRGPRPADAPSSSRTSACSAVCSSRPSTPRAGRGWPTARTWSTTAPTAPPARPAARPSTWRTRPPARPS